MPSNPGIEVPLAVALRQEHFRLMELTPELADLLASPDPPILKLKSLESGHAALCLPHKTFQLRQVSTSNSVHILRPVRSSDTQESTASQSLVSAISQCTSTLEMLSGNLKSAVEYLKETLPVLHVHSDAECPPESTFSSTQAVRDNIPLSDEQIDDAWIELCAFEYKGCCWQPSARAMMKAVSSMSSTAILQGVDLSEPVIPARLDYLVESIYDVPHPLVRAVFKHLIMIDSASTMRLDRQRTTFFVGKVLLVDLVEVQKSDLMMQWSNLLPESWRDVPSWDLLDGLYTETQSGNTVRLNSFQLTPVGSDVPMAASTSNRNKWHEKFKSKQAASK